ncbi:hypothetical protein BJ742DRAFT_846973 [Cladochytrium replicatum]|nr:hypothetical protein BJ742DRAFT_846973 [Cladochytrium replicatum]
MQRAASMPVQSWLTQQQSPQPFSTIGYAHQQQNLQQFNTPYGGSVQPPSMVQYGSSPTTYGSMRNPASPPHSYTTPPGTSPSTFSPIAAARPEVPVRYDTTSSRGGGPSVPPRSATMNMNSESPPRVSRSGKSDRVLKWLKAVDTNENASSNRSGLPASPSSPPQYGGYLSAVAATDVYSDVDSIMSPHTVVTHPLSSVGSNLRKTPTEVSYATAVPPYRSPTEVSYASMHSAVPSYKSGSTATPMGTPVRNNNEGGGFLRKASLPQLKFDNDGTTPPQLPPIPGIVSPSVSTFWQGPLSVQGTNSDGSPAVSNAALNSSVDTSAAEEEEKRRTVLSLMSSNTGSMLLDVSVLMQGIKMMQGGAGAGGANGTHRPSPLGQEVGKDAKKVGDKKDEESSKLMVERLLTMLPQVEESSPRSARQRSMTLPSKLQSPAISLPPPPTSQPPPPTSLSGSLPRSPKERTGPGFGPYSLSQPNLSAPPTNQQTIQTPQSAQSVVIMGLPQPLIFTAVPQNSSATQNGNPPRSGYTHHANESTGTLKSTESLVRQPSVSSGSAIGTPSLHAATTPQLAAAGIDVGSHLPAHLIPARNSSGPKRWQHTKKPSLPSLATQSAPSTPLRTTAGMELPLRKESLSQLEIPPVPPPKEFSGVGLLARADGEVEMGVLYGNNGTNAGKQPTTPVRTTTSAESPPPPNMSPVVVVPDRALPVGRKRSEGALGSPIVPPKSAARSSVLYANVIQQQRGSIGGTFHFEADEVENKGNAGPASPEAEPLFSRRTSKASESAEGGEDRFGMSPGAYGPLAGRAGNRNSESESSNFFAAIAAAVLAEQGAADADEENGGGEDDGVFPRWKVRLTFSGGEEGEEVAGETVQAVMSEYDLAVDPRNSIYTLATVARHKGERGSLRRRSSAPDFQLEEFEEEQNGEGKRSKEALGQQAAILKRMSSMGRRGSGTSAYWARRINALAKEYGDLYGGVHRPSSGSATLRHWHGGSDALGGSNILGVSVAESDVSSAGTPNMGLTDDILNMYDGDEEGELARSSQLRTEAMQYGKTAAVKEDAVAVFQRALGIGRGGSGVGNWMAVRSGPATTSKSKLVSNRVS